jgi:hypothetical protein
MKTTHGRKTHDGSPHSHHEHAMRLHHDAAKHYNEGKDYAHAAHQALVAHGHALLALALAQEAFDRYLKLGNLEPSPVKASAGRSEPVSLSPAGLVQSSQHVCEHHLAAAELHEHAARYLSQAGAHYAQGDVALAAHEAQAAHALTLCAIDHANQAAKHHARGCCVADPGARQVLPVAA